jgi:glycosyltransferase involved in cell wall biosynthesis
MAACRPPADVRVLFLSWVQIFPPLSGGNLRSFALVNALKRHGLEISVYSMVGRKKDYLSLRPSSVQLWPQGIEEYVDRKAFWFLAQHSCYWLALPPVWMTAYLRVAASSPREILLPRLLREKLAWCNTVVVDFPFSHPVFSTPSGRGRLRVVSTHNVEHRMYDDESHWHNRRIRAAVREIELKAAEVCDILVSCCSGDAEFFVANASVRESVVVPNGIDVRRFHGIETHRDRVRQELGLAENVRLFLFTASKWGPNLEAFEYLKAFAQEYGRLLAEQRIHILVVGNVTPRPMRFPGFTATSRVEVVEPYFAAADAALNPVTTGAGTNLKMCEFLALRLPIATTLFGARGFRIEDGKTGFLFERDELAAVLTKVRRLFDEDPQRLRRMAEDAYGENEGVIEMDQSVGKLVELIVRGRAGSGC